MKPIDHKETDKMNALVKYKTAILAFRSMLKFLVSYTIKIDRVCVDDSLRLEDGTGDAFLDLVKEVEAAINKFRSKINREKVKYSIDDVAFIFEQGFAKQKKEKFTDEQLALELIESILPHYIFIKYQNNNMPDIAPCESSNEFHQQLLDKFKPHLVTAITESRATTTSSCSKSTEPGKTATRVLFQTAERTVNEVRRSRKHSQGIIDKILFEALSDDEVLFYFKRECLGIPIWGEMPSARPELSTI